MKKQIQQYKEKVIVLTGGGTGGHIYPAVAIGKEILKYPDTKIYYVGNPQNLEKTITANEDFSFLPINISGIPKNMNGSIGPQGEKVIKYCNYLKNKLQIEVVFWDERLTTVAAHRAMLEADLSREKRSKIVDKLAAVYILQGYLDRLNIEKKEAKSNE